MTCTKCYGTGELYRQDSGAHGLTMPCPSCALVEVNQWDREAFDKSNMEWAMGDADIGAKLIAAHAEAEALRAVKLALERAEEVARRYGWYNTVTCALDAEQIVKESRNA